MELADRRIDLHSHSIASDGTDSPTQLVERAASLGLSAIGLTDHDTIAGVREAISAADVCGIELVPGIELSIEDGDIRRFHLLSYFFDLDNPQLTQTLENVRRWRSDRNAMMLERAKAAGINLTLEEVQNEAGPDAEVLGRPHFAQALIKKGLATSVADAFDRYLSAGRPLHEPKPSLTPQKAAELLHAAGGVTVLAHPGLIKWADRTELANYVAALKEADVLDGIECYYFRYDEEQTQFFLDLARDLGLLVSGGSDYHGDTKPDVPLGAVYQGKALPAAILEPLRQESERRRAHLTGS